MNERASPQPWSRKAPRFLILRGGAIGDFLFTLPALTALRRQWPDAYLELIGYPHIAELAVAGGLADRVRSLDSARVAAYFVPNASLEEEQKEYIRSFDLVISYLYDPSGAVCENLRAAGARQVLYGSPVVESGHAADHLMRPLAALAIFPEGGETPRLRLKPELAAQGIRRASALGRRVVAVHPGSGSVTKNWPLWQFIELAGLIRAGAGTPVFIVGEADEAIARRLPTLAPDAPVLSGLSLVELAAFLAACCGYVGNDTGITHLAAALGIPTVAIFGPTDPAVWGPRGANAAVVTGPGRTSEALSRIGAETVFDRLREVMAKAEN